MEQTFPTRNILCIDLKSFFATCECFDRGLDPFKTALVVADPDRGGGAITLAVTPLLKSKGVKSRGRVFEIPKHLNYTIVKPRMNLYLKKSKEVVDLYSEFVSEEDMYVYSIDEVWMDVTDYLKMYKKTDYELALEILDVLYKKTGMLGTCGIGPNMLLAKIAMDVEAKHNNDFIAKWEYKDIPSKLWPITPLSKVWGIGPRMEKKLNTMGLYKIEDIAKFSRDKLKVKFGIMGTELWDHANGIDLKRISDWKVPAKEKSFNHSQVLFKDYYGDNIKIIIDEMVEVLATRLRKEKKMTGLIAFGIGYSKDIQSGFYHSLKLENATDNTRTLIDMCYTIFDQYYDNSPIRKVSVSFGKLRDKDHVQLNMFETLDIQEKRDTIYKTIDDVKDKFGKNSIVKASALLEDSTILERNKKTRGHSS